MKKNIIGTMSGSSFDGIDIAYVTISEDKNNNYTFKLNGFRNYNYSKELKIKLLSLSQTTTVSEISKLNFYLGEVFSDYIKKFLKECKINENEVDLISSHGQTIFHQPKKEKYLNKKISSTLQIGEPSVIAERCKIKTIADFRPRDIACGGQGAPLTAAFHYHFFKKYKRNIIVDNIGGISNLTFIPADGAHPYGFDTGPGNMMIDAMVQRYIPKNIGYDKNGGLSKNGRVIPALKDFILSHPFIQLPPPKTTGREDFGFSYTNKIIKKFHLDKKRAGDIIKTFVSATALSICANIKRYILNSHPVEEIVFTGGGAKNKTLLSIVKNEFPDIKISIFNDYGIDVKAVEAVAFAFLAFLTEKNLPSNMPETTGAQNSAILGKIIPSHFAIKEDKILYG